MLRYIKTYIAEHGFAPSIPEIASGTGLSSTNSTRAHLLVLSEQGYIAMQPGRARTIVVLEAS